MGHTGLMYGTLPRGWFAIRDPTIALNVALSDRGREVPHRPLDLVGLNRVSHVFLLPSGAVQLRNSGVREY